MADNKVKINCSTFVMKHGLYRNLPKGRLGEPLYCTDTNVLYIGQGDDKIPIPIASPYGNMFFSVTTITERDNLKYSGEIQTGAMCYVEDRDKYYTFKQGEWVEGADGDLMTNAIAHSKSKHAPVNAQANVQADWEETDVNSDAYIQNKPDVLSGKQGTTFTPSVDAEGNLSWTNDGELVNPETVNIKGAKGDKGEKGDKGDKGDTGAKGVTPTLLIGTTTTGEPGTSANVIMSSNNNVYTFNFTIPKGDKGDKGDSGESGSGVATDTVVTTNAIGGTLTLTLDKHQYASINNDTTIVLPSVTGYTEIHLYFNVGSNIPGIVFPNGKYQKTPSLSTNKAYEFIFTYINDAIGWLVGYIEYSA